MDRAYVGDVWCYCIGQGELNAMLSYCVFDRAFWGRGMAAAALKRFLKEMVKKYNVKTVGAFTYAVNGSSIRVLEKCGFDEMETFSEDGTESKYFQWNAEAAM